MKKVKLFLLGLLAMLIMIPVKAAVDELGTVEAFMNDVEDVNVDTPNAENVVVTFKKMNLKWVEADTSIGRNSAGWWVGFKMKAPNNITDEGAFTTAKYYQPGTEPKPMWGSMSDDEKANKYLGFWKSIDETVLEGKNDTFDLISWEFDWDGDGHTDQTVTIKIDPTEKGITFEEPSNEEYVKINVDGQKIFIIKKGQTLSTLTEEERALLDKLMTPEAGYRLVGLFMTKDDQETRVDIDSTVFEDDAKLTIKFEEIPTVQPTPSKPVVDDKEIIVEEPKGDENISLSTDANDILKDSLINTEDKELKELIEKNDVTIVLENEKVEKDTLLKEELEKFASVIEGANVAEYFDLNIVVKASGQTNHYLKELSKPITLTIDLPELPEVKDGFTRKYYILREHDGIVEKLDATLTKEGKLSFATDKFSKYALAYVDEEIKDTVIDNNPSTVDNIMSYVTLAIASVGVVGIALKKTLKR